MKTAWYVLVGEEDTKEKECTMTGAYWLEAKSGEYRCFYLTRPSDSQDCGDSDPKTVRAPKFTSANFYSPECSVFPMPGSSPTVQTTKWTLVYTLN